MLAVSSSSADVHQLERFGPAHNLKLQSVDPSLFGKAMRLLPEPLHLHGLPGGRRSRGLDLGGGRPLGGPPPRLVLLERVAPRLNAPQGASVAYVHLLRSHLLAAGPLEARAAHAGLRPAAGAAVLAGRLAVS